MIWLMLVCLALFLTCLYFGYGWLSWIASGAVFLWVRAQMLGIWGMQVDNAPFFSKLGLFALTITYLFALVFFSVRFLRRAYVSKYIMHVVAEILPKGSDT